jgi:diguanylate cyclase (GGDEF)-like protein/PAS domain S-box-containing protein
MTAFLPCAPFPLPSDDCAQEAIHLPGAIQPNGALLAVGQASRTITHASANLGDYLAVDARTALRSSLESVLGEDACQALMRGTDGTSSGCDHVLPRGDGTSLYLRAYRTGDHVCIDIEPQRTDASRPPPIIAALPAIEAFTRNRGCLALCESAVQGLRSISGYDRVMAYRFSPDGHGEVIAEAAAPGLAPYLGLHYPASDIPPQARRQYLAHPVGAIGDAAYVPAPLLSASSDPLEPPLDLTQSAVRSVSPYHRSYMRNMGTAASLTVALVERDRLWGMLVCHHGSPRWAGPELRAVTGLIGQVVSLLIPGVAETETLARQAAKRATLGRLDERMAAAAAMGDLLAGCGADLADLVDASGVMAKIEGCSFVHGVLPPPADADAIWAGLLAEPAGDILAFDDLWTRFPAWANASGPVCGALLLRLPGNDAIAWFRPEMVQTVHWGRTTSTDSSLAGVEHELSPDRSFLTWRELKRGSSRPWSDADLGTVRAFGESLKTRIAEHTRRSLRGTESRFQLLAEYSGVVVTLNDAQSVGRYVSPASESVLGWKPEEMLGRNALDLVHPDDRAALLNERATLMSGSSERSACYRFMRPDGSWLWVEAHVRLRGASDGDAPDDHVVVLRDATERKAAENELADALARVERIAAIDGLTGLSNRRHFDEIAEKEWRRCQRDGMPLSLILLDVDHFKLYNDRHGHLAGDSALKAISHCLTEAARRPADLAARYGGEEFLLLMPGTDVEAASAIAQSLRLAVQALAIDHLDNELGVITISLGVASAAPTGVLAGALEQPAIEPLLASADAALYVAKSKGRNRVELASSMSGRLP